ncbi:response regulator transcription factor [Amycolatopsis jiangsuensis]|uniref:DNA-binding NarL/FixJ family response regulator n=1 Tax=Amycolatopsis jiangsuensis TaxID=1181879 RepID=A0A840IZY8_9PSEU|nr:response regulator transcription factor [Amycolatopsis jiangsuensis]MBB4687390.1 DNA-binding NarL/FixJ family response regulator [Amycolatopsis jiangsuensis]
MRGIEPHRTPIAPGQPAGSRSLGVAVVDPIPLFREGVASMVHRTLGLHWSGQAASHHAAMQLCEQARPDVVILDSALDPNCHLVKMLNSGDPALVLVVLVRDGNRTQQYLAAAIGAGAHAIVPRAVDGRRMAESIRRAHTDRRYLDPALSALTARPKRQPSPRAALDDGQLVHPKGAMPLSRREYQVLQLVAEGLENSAIAKLLFLSVETVRTHVKSILRKLSARDRTHAVTIAFRSGILVPQIDDQAAVLPAQHSVARSTR